MVRRFLRTTGGILFCGLLLATIQLWAQPCTLPSRTFLPTADEATSRGFGEAIDVDGEYMVAGVALNSYEQAYSGIAFVYKLGSDKQWAKIAELTPSDAGKWGRFGRLVTISGNSIVISGLEYNDNGDARTKLYVYEKPVAGEWVSATENYVIVKSFPTATMRSGISNFALHGDDLVVTGVDHGADQLEIYSKSGGVFSLSQAIALPYDGQGSTGYSWVMALTGNFVAIGTEQFQNADGSNGAVFVYEKIAGNYRTTPAVLKSAGQSSTSWKAFGIGIAATNSTLYVAGLLSNATSYDQTFYVFTKPATGWADTQQSHILSHPGYNYYEFKMVVTDDYLFCPAADFKSVVGFKRQSSGWSSGATKFIIDDLPADKYLFGSQLELIDEHLVVGCVSRYLTTGKSEEWIVDYYSATGEWEDPAVVCGQKLQAIEIDATDDFFGGSFDVYNGKLAISADGDDDLGSNTGAVYIFDRNIPSATPEQKIYNPEMENNTGFGYRIAMGNGVMFISAPFKDSLYSNQQPKFYNVGKVYIYRLTPTGWKYSSQIVAPSVKSETTFGMNVVCSAGYVAVTEFYSGSSESVGHVHIYKENSSGKFEFIATLDPATHLRSDFFGKSIVMTDTMMVIGTGHIAPNSSYRLSAYIFMKKGEWKSTTEDASLMSTNSGWGDRFSASVSMSGDYIVVGAPYSPGFDPRPIPRGYIIPGAAYVYKRPAGGWKGRLMEIAKISPSDPVEMGTFGSSVVIDRDDIFIGAPSLFERYNYSDNITNNDGKLIPGKVYHYKKPPGGWVTTSQEARQIQSFEPEFLDGYGAKMLVSDRYLYVSAMLDDTPSGFRSGSVQTMMQLPAVDNLPVSCTDQAPIQLSGLPGGGVWSGPGINPAQKIFNPSVSGAGDHLLRYNIYGCEVTVQAKVMSAQFTLHGHSDLTQEKCSTARVQLAFRSNVDPLRYAWHFSATSGGSFTPMASSTQEVVVAAPGFYRVTVDRGVCPKRTEVFRVIDENPVSIAINPAPVVCADEAVTLVATPASGTWSGRGITAQGRFNPSGIPDGSYKVTYKVVTPVGCQWKDSVNIRVDILKEPALLDHEDVICGNTPVPLTLGNVDERSTFTWHDEHMSAIANAKDKTLNVTKPGIYSARVSKHACSYHLEPVTLTSVRDTLFVPNVFTANGDSYNDYFEINGEGFDGFFLSVYNKYGKRIFVTNDRAFKWSSEGVASGVYYWRASYVSCAGAYKEQKGWVHVVK